LTAANVLPEIGMIAPGPARAAIREAFLTHVIGGKRLSRSSVFTRMVRGATPDLVLAGVEVLADVVGEVMVVDVGGATTDVYSVLDHTEPGLSRAVSGDLPAVRSVEGDLGMRWSATGVIEAAAAERLVPGPLTIQQSAAFAANPGFLPITTADRAADADLARLAAVIAARRHARAPHPAESGRELKAVKLVLGSGGVLRHGDDALRKSVLEAVTDDRGGGWQVPDRARVAVDERYLVFAIGLMATLDPPTARRLAIALAEDVL
jgi:uncharacterized protein (TIGR01319 family)